MTKKSTVAVLVSGGLDSDVLLARLAKSRCVVPIYIRQGLKWETVELYWLRRFLKRLPSRTVQPLQVLSVPMSDVYGRHWSVGDGKVPGARTPDRAVYLPGRNLILSVKASVLCAMKNIPKLAIGSLDHNPFPDASPRFFNEWGKALTMGLGRRVRIWAPYRRQSKAQVIRKGKEFPLEFSFSCIAPRGLHHCGQCNKCAERRRAFRTAGVADKTIYAKR